MEMDGGSDMKAFPACSRDAFFLFPFFLLFSLLVYILLVLLLLFSYLFALFPLTSSSRIYMVGWAGSKIGERGHLELAFRSARMDGWLSGFKLTLNCSYN